MSWLLKMRKQGLTLVGTMAKPLIKRIVKKELEKEENKKMIVDLVNAKVNLPKLDEKEEEVLFNQLYEAVQESLDKVVERI